MGFNTVICIGKMMLKLWGVPNVPTISYLLSRFIDVYNMHPANQYDIWKSSRQSATINWSFWFETRVGGIWKMMILLGSKATHRWLTCWYMLVTPCPTCRYEWYCMYSMKWVYQYKLKTQHKYYYKYTHDIDMDAHGWIELWCSTKPMCSTSLCYHIRQIHPWSPVKNPSDWGDYLQLSILNRTTVIRKIQSGHLVTIVVLISRRGRWLAPAAVAYLIKSYHKSCAFLLFLLKLWENPSSSCVECNPLISYLVQQNLMHSQLAANCK